MANDDDHGIPSDEAIAKRAYELYLQRGSISGDGIDDWLQAEAELIAEANAARGDRDRAQPDRPTSGAEPRDIRPEPPRPAARERNNHRRARAL